MTLIPERTLGLDLGDKWSFYCLLDVDGACIGRGRARTSPLGMRKLLGELEPSRVVLEVGPHSPWVSRLGAAAGHDVVVANARRVKLIYESDTKNDKVDAETLARLGRVDTELLRPIQHRAAECQADLAVVRARDQLVRMRTALVNHVRGAVKATGNRVRSCSTASFHLKAADDIPDELKPALTPILESLSRLSEQIRRYDRMLEATATSSYPETERLRTVPGVGTLTALTFVLTLEDPRRFKKSRSVGAYLGLRPKQKASGQSDRLLRITKAGDAHVRRLLVGAAHYILGPFGPDTRLREWGMQLVARAGKKRAAVAVARKLAVLLHRLWTTGETYRLPA